MSSKKLIAVWTRLAANLTGGANFKFWHDLNCRSGFGDRLADLWGALAVAELHEPGVHVAVLWEPKGFRYQGFVGQYSTKLFSVDKCTFTRFLPSGADRDEKGYKDDEVCENCIVDLSGDRKQIILSHGRYWGNNSPSRIHDNLTAYKLDADMGIDQVVAAYKKRARGTHPAQIVADAIPSDIEQRVGVHVRLTDKLGAEENAHEMSADSWSSLEASGWAYIDECIGSGQPLFVCSDDMKYRSAMVKRIRDRGGDVVVAELPEDAARLPGYGAMVDYFALSRSKHIAMMTKYSTFSITAAIAGNKQLVQFSGAGNDTGNKLDIWRETLDIVDHCAA